MQTSVHENIAAANYDFCLPSAVLPTAEHSSPVFYRQWKRRFDVYVCTAAERGYALEAWRLLDSNNDIIPDNVRSVRVVCVPGGQKKELRRVFRIQAPIMYQSGSDTPISIPTSVHPSICCTF